MLGPVSTADSRISDKESRKGPGRRSPNKHKKPEKTQVQSDKKDGDHIDITA